jgi:SAM-dependent methyltransferase
MKSGTSSAPQLPDFEAMFVASDDPWHFRSRWYEQRKRALTLACLPAPAYACAYEPGCANGELAAALAPRCTRLLVSDGAAAAVEIARERLAELPQVQVVQALVPQQWPEESFDLIVFSELGYYLDAPALSRLVERIGASLRPGGTVLACHWRWPIEGCTLDGDAVHRQLDAALGLPLLAHHLEPDLVLDVWSEDGRSIAQREGLTSAAARPRAPGADASRQRR